MKTVNSEIKPLNQLRLLVGSVLTALFCNGCAINGPQSTVTPNGPVAQAEFKVYLVTLGVCAAIFLVVGSVMAYCLYRYRDRGDSPDQLPPQGHGNPLLEIGVVGISVLLVSLMVYPTVKGIFYIGSLPPGSKPLLIKVTGYQWWWRFEYPDQGVVTANEIAIPAGRPVKFELKTHDVIHSFWIPRLGGKVDMIPNQNNWLWLEANPEIARGYTDPVTGKTSSGVLYGQCAEFCGESHAFMRFRVLVLKALDFEQWIQHQKSDAPPPPPGSVASTGQKVFNTVGCTTCHTVRGNPIASGTLGPDLTHVGSRLTLAAGTLPNNRANMRKWLLNPHAVKPGNMMWRLGYVKKNVRTGQAGMDVISKLNALTVDEFDALVTYVENLK